MKLDRAFVYGLTACILLVSSLAPEQNTIDHSNEEKIPVLGTALSTFEITGLLYQKIKIDK